MSEVSGGILVEGVLDGVSNARVDIYKRSSTKPNDKPADGCVYNFNDGTLTGTLNGWSTVIPENDGTPCWVRHATAISDNVSVIINASDWCDAVKMIEDGYNTAVVPLYRRSATALTDSDRPTGKLTYTFSTGVLSGNASRFNSWSQSMPAATPGTKLYVTMATARSTTDTDDIAKNEWSTPVEYVADGMNSAPVVIYKRADSIESNDTPADGCEYTFSTGVLSGTLNGWSTNIPNDNGKPCWVRHATAVSSSTKDVINASEWSAAQKHVESGTSPYFADLDNEMDSVACDNAGKPKSEQTVETNVSLYHGSNKLSPTIEVRDDSPTGSQYTNGTKKNGITITWNNSTGNISVKFSTTATLANVNTFCIKLSATVDGENIVRYLYFTVNGVRGTALYRLVPSINEIIKKKDGSYVPTGDTYITCDVTKNVGGTQSTPASSEYSLKYILNGGSETDYTATSIKVSQVTSNVVFILRVGDVVVDRETIGVITDGTDGTSPYFADLDNEMDSVACDSDGYVTSEQFIESNVSFFYGNVKQTIKNSGGIVCKINGYLLRDSYQDEPSPASNYKAIVENPGTESPKVKIYIKNGTIITSTKITIEVKATVNGSDKTSVVNMTMNGIRPGAVGENAVIYNLLPCVSEINVGRTSSNGYDPSTFRLVCGYKKSDGGSITSESDKPSRIDEKYYIYYRRRTRSSQNWETTYYRYDYWRDDANHSLLALDVATYDKVEFVLCTCAYTSFSVSNLGSYILVDKETVPVVTDGEKAVEYKISLAGSVFANDPNYSGGKMHVNIKGKVYKVEGGNTTVFTSLTSSMLDLSYIEKDGDVYNFNTGEFSVGTGSNAGTFSTTLYNNQGWSEEEIFLAVLRVGGVEVARESIQIEIYGINGQSIKGDTGKMCYIAGEYDPAFIYRSNDTQTVAVEVPVAGSTETKLYVLKTLTNVDGDGVHHGPSDTDYWEEGLNRYNLLRTKYLFADFAKLGSGVVSGDWLFSAKGTINGTVYNDSNTHGGVAAYMAFNGDDPSGKGIKKVNDVTKTLAYNVANSGYFGSVVLTQGRDLVIKANGYRNDYSTNKVYLKLYQYKINATTGVGEYILAASLVWDSVTETEKTLTFTVMESGTYYLRVEHTTSSSSGNGSSRVSNIVATEFGFAPNFAVDLLTGQTYQHSGLFTGFIRKSKTLITTSNINNYKRADITADTVLDFDKCGSFIELSTGTQSYFAIPILSNYYAPMYTEAQKDYMRTFVGTKLMVYNKTGATLNIHLNSYFSTTDKSSTGGVTNNNTAIGTGGFVILECKLRGDPVNGDENVYWEELGSGTIV